MYILEIKRMQKIAGIITESEYRMFVEAIHDETLEEGWKNWLMSGLITLSTIAGIGKVYQMDKQAEEDRAKRTEYYNDVLSNEIDKLSDNSLTFMGYDINKITRDRAVSPDSKLTPQDISDAMASYAKEYMKARPNEFSVGQNGGIFWNKAQWSFNQFKDSKTAHPYNASI